MHRLLIVDDQRSSRELMCYAAGESDAYHIVGTLEGADEAVRFCQTSPVDLILMDIYTEGKLNGIAAAHQIKQLCPNTKLIIVTFMVQPRYLEEARQAGFEGFWYKDHGSRPLLAVMDAVMQGERVYPDEPPVVSVGQAKSTDFTKQELRVLQAKVNGHSNAETCRQLGITISTLNYHIGNLKSKTGYDSLLRITADVVLQRFIIADRAED